MKKILLFLLTTTILLGCKTSNERLLTSATGTIYECLVVINALPLNQIADSLNHIFSTNAYAEEIHTAGDWIKATLEQEMACLPQMEPTLSVSLVNHQQFDNFLKPTRNILIVDIDSTRYSVAQAKYFADYWSHPQVVCRVQLPNESDFIPFWNTNGAQIREWFVSQELARQANFYKAFRNKELCQKAKEIFNITICIPEDYTLVKDTTVFLFNSAIKNDVRVLWGCNPKGSMRRDIVIYSYPYVEDSTFTKDFLCLRRDDVLSQLVSGTVKGSFMGTEYKYCPPQMHILPSTTGEYVAEMRGLWKLYHGEAMGGPFVSHTRLDTIANRVITTEVFLFASGQKKRNALRQAEAILYTQNFVLQDAEK